MCEVWRYSACALVSLLLHFETGGWIRWPLKHRVVLTGFNRRTYGRKNTKRKQSWWWSNAKVTPSDRVSGKFQNSRWWSHMPFLDGKSSKNSPARNSLWAEQRGVSELKWLNPTRLPSLAFVFEATVKSHTWEVFHSNPNDDSHHSVVVDV